jgi:hypothetical protein
MSRHVVTAQAVIDMPPAAAYGVVADRRAA